MSTTLTNGLKLPDKGSVDWYADMQNNYAILDGAVGTIAEHTSALAGKAPLSHTHTKSDVTDLLNSNFIPSANSTYDLGSSSYQWNNLYAKNYYYNGTAWGLDKANTWTGSNSYTGIVLLNSSSDVAEQFKQKLPKDVSVSSDALVRFNTLTDSEDHNVVIEALGHWASYVSKSVTLKYKNDSTKQGVIDFRLESNGSGIFYPQSPFECYLGNSSNQWKSVYAQTYFYNGTAWGLDKKNVWTNYNVINGYRFTIRQTSQEIGVIPSSNQWNGFNFVDKNEANTVSFQHAFLSSGETRFTLSMVDNVASHDSNSTVWIEFLRLTAYSGGMGFIIGADARPMANNAYELGTSTNKWKTLNGINPGALSLPNVRAAVADPVDTVNWNLTGSRNTYTPTENGWFFIRVAGTGNCAINIHNGSSSNEYPTWFNSSTNGYATLVVPCEKEISLYIYISATSIEHCSFRPCLGNV